MGGRGSGGHNSKVRPEPLAKGDPWQRQPRESDPAWEAFVTYRDMGLSRSVVTAAKALSKSTTTVNRWVGRWSWRARATAWDTTKDNVITAAALESLTDMARRHMETSREAQDFLRDQLRRHVAQADHNKKVPHAELRTIIRGIKDLSRLDRLVRDQATEKVDIGQQLDLSKLSVPELKQLRALQEKATVREDT